MSDDQFPEANGAIRRALRKGVSPREKLEETLAERMGGPPRREPGAWMAFGCTETNASGVYYPFACSCAHWLYGRDASAGPTCSALDACGREL